MRELGYRGKKRWIRDDVRVSIADSAARLISEGMTDFHAAKLKAARLLGVSDAKSLPDNHEIEAALRARIALFHADSQAAALEELRTTAIRAMRWLDRFSPWLAGAVLNGTANALSTIELELITTESKEFELFLVNQGVNFATRKAAAGARASSTVQYEIEFEEAPVLVALFDNQAQRHAAYPRDSIRHDRVQLVDAEKLFARQMKP